MTVAAQPLSDCLQSATGIAAHAITENHFDLLLLSNEKLGASSQQGNLWLKEVKIYFRIVRAIDGICAKALPGLSIWTKNELVSCAKYAAAVLDERLNSSLAYGSEMASN